MDWKDIGKFAVGNGAKLLGGVLGGPVGAKVGTIISTALGVEDEPDKVYEHLQSNPDAILKLKEIEANHEVELQKLGLAELQARLVDVQSARGREVEITKTTGKRDFLMVSLGGTVVIGFFASYIISLFSNLPQANIVLITSFASTLQAGFITVLTYFYGSSAGSARKTEIMKNGNGNESEAK